LAIITGAIITGTLITPVIARALVTVFVAVVVAIGAVDVTVDAVIVKAFTATAAFGLAITIIAEDTEIMFGILQIIFCGHPVTGLLSVTGQGAIFLQQLGGVATLAIVEPGPIIVAAGHLLRARTIVAATAPPPLVVPDQARIPRCLAVHWPLIG
jgi:hypothetical protein